MKLAYMIPVAVVIAFLGLPRPASAQEGKEKVAAVKASLAGSHAILRGYEWTETTTISLKGEEKAQTVKRCFYGPDGKVQKVPITAPPEQAAKRGIRGRIVEKKKEELTEYMKEAVELVKAYVPPDPERLRAAEAEGKLTIQPVPGGNKARLTFKDYLKKGDSLGIDLDTKDNRLAGVEVATYMDSDKEPVTMTARFDTMQASIVYPAKIVLDAKGKHLNVTVENSGYRKVAEGGVP
jgi:hypothetical protein